MKPLKFLAALFLVFSFLAPATALAGEAVYYFFRHAEKIAGGENPRDLGLTDEGITRAENLVELLEDTGVTRIFSSDYIRTRDTVAPLSVATGIEIEIYDPRDLPGFAALLKEMEGVIVISGHSNTTPELTALLSGHETEPMDEDEYDRLYMVEKSGEEFAVTTLRQHKTGTP